jgi:ferredoxin
MIQHFELMTPLLEAGAVINLPKLKTHSLMIMTGAVKNCFGAVPGRIKPGYHAKLPDRVHFARMLLDLAACLKPGLTIMDAVVGMEGDGPGNGDPRPVGLLLGAENPLAMDVVVGEIMGLAPEDNPLLVEAETQGRTPTRLDEIELVGIEREQLRIPDFKLPSTHSPLSGLQQTGWWQRLVSPLIKSGLTLEPRVIEEACVACQDCVRICPEGVIEIEQAEHPYAWIDKEGCIRCYCCHETCPEDAIALHKSLLYRLVMG